MRTRVPLHFTYSKPSSGTPAGPTWACHTDVSQTPKLCQDSSLCFSPGWNCLATSCLQTRKDTFSWKTRLAFCQADSSWHPSNPDTAHVQQVILTFIFSSTRGTTYKPSRAHGALDTTRKCCLDQERTWPLTSGQSAPLPMSERPFPSLLGDKDQREGQCVSNKDKHHGTGACNHPEYSGKQTFWEPSRFSRQLAPGLVTRFGWFPTRVTSLGEHTRRRHSAGCPWTSPLPSCR